jgi:hypothetical protein
MKRIRCDRIGAYPRSKILNYSISSLGHTVASAHNLNHKSSISLDSDVGSNIGDFVS